jgi:hypothetical protein
MTAHSRLQLLGAVLVIGAAPVARAQNLWTSEGYGYLIDASSDSLRAFEVTSISCIASFTAVAVPAPAGAAAAYRFVGAPVTVLLLPDKTSGAMRFHMNGAASDVILRRATAKPAVCDRPTPNTPASNFDVFARTWAEQYGFFDLKHVDWSAIVAANRAKVTDSTPPAQLFAVLQGMIEPLHDAHTYIGGQDSSLRFFGSREGNDRVPREQWPRALATVEKYLTGGLRKFCQGQLEFGMLTPDIAYLRIRGFSRYTSDGSFDSGLIALEASLDTIFADAASWKGLVTDVRINGGGADPLGLAIAGRLTAKDYVAYVKEARLDPNDPSKWTPGQTSWVRATARPGFRGPVVHLIGIHSVSAAETFTQALLDREPAVTRIGQNTQGVFSDVLGRRLPNGWRFGLPNERFVTDGKTYDGTGIPPTIRVPVFTPDDLESRRDSAIERALVVLGEPRK